MFVWRQRVEWSGPGKQWQGRALGSFDDDLIRTLFYLDILPVSLNSLDSRKSANIFSFIWRKIEREWQGPGTRGDVIVRNNKCERGVLVDRLLQQRISIHYIQMWFLTRIRDGFALGESRAADTRTSSVFSCSRSHCHTTATRSWTTSAHFDEREYMEWGVLMNDFTRGGVMGTSRVKNKNLRRRFLFVVRLSGRSASKSASTLLFIIFILITFGISLYWSFHLVRDPIGASLCPAAVFGQRARLGPPKHEKQRRPRLEEYIYFYL